MASATSFCVCSTPSLSLIHILPEGQKYIYFAAGEDADRLAKLPAAELVLDKGYDLLLLTEDVDEFCLQMMRSYEEKEFKNINSGDLGLETEEEKKQAEEAAEENKPLFEACLLYTSPLGQVTPGQGNVLLPPQQPEQAQATVQNQPLDSAGLR